MKKSKKKTMEGRKTRNRRRKQKKEGRKSRDYVRLEGTKEGRRDGRKPN